MLGARHVHEIVRKVFRTDDFIAMRRRLETITLYRKRYCWGRGAVSDGVYDWVEDCWHDNYIGAPTDGSAWIEADCAGHVLRGGAAARALQTRRSAARIWFGSPNRMSYMSLRVARTLGR